MALTQRFQLISAGPGLPPDVGCYGCQATFTEGEVPDEGPAGALVMVHKIDCPEVGRLITR